MTQSGHQEAFEFDQTRLAINVLTVSHTSPLKSENSSFWNYTCRFGSRQHIPPN
jgi:hypothetical protein